MAKNYLSLYTGLFLLLTSCGIPQKLSNVGEPPQLSQIQNPTQMYNYQPISMPMPQPTVASVNNAGNSLWQAGSKAFFKDQRANKEGDILTALIDIDQKESIEMNPNLKQTVTGKNVVTNALGLEHKLEKFFPKKQHSDGKNNPTWVDTSRSPSLQTTAKYDVTDKLKFKIAATIIQILPNGNMVIHGKQEIRLINEVREIEIKGIVRREDINSSNTIAGDKIAELRIAYGGRGDLSEMQSFPWGHQILNKVLPF